MIASRIDIALLSICLVGIAAAAEAQSEPDAATPSLLESIAEAHEAAKLPPDTERGRELYAVCAECHLASGAGEPDGTMPQLAGQHREVLIKQLMDIRSGLRQNPQMYPFVARLDGAQDLSDVAGYIASLPIPDDTEIGVGPGAPADLERGRVLYEKNCLRCHGANGEGMAAVFYPMLQGQHYRYLVRQIVDIASGRRGNANHEMAEVIAKFSAADVANVADYISHLFSANITTNETGK